MFKNCLQQGYRVENAEVIVLKLSLSFSKQFHLKQYLFFQTETILQDGSSIPENDIDEPMEVTEPASLNFDKLFEACGGRTAHK